MAQAIVTGGAVRVGKAICLALADAGFDIILIFKDSLAEAKETAEAIKAKGRQCFMHKCDLSLKENIDVLFADLARRYDSMELLVNSASVFQKYSFMETSEQIFDAHIDINFKAPFFMTQNFARYVQKREYIKNANVINIGDKKVSELHTGHFAYFLSKRSLHDLTEMCAKDLAPGVRVNSISLGKVLPPVSRTEKIELDKYPRMKEIGAAVIALNRSSDVGRNIIIESDPEL